MHLLVRMAHVLAAVSAAALPGTGALAQPYPSKPVRLVIPFPPGGASDILARTVGERVGEALKQRIVVDNRAGGGGLIAIELVSTSAPDGHTLLQIATSFVINPSLYRQLPYDATSGFTPVALLAVADNVLVSHPSLPARTPRELIALARSKPRDLNYAHTGFGTQAFLAAELFKQEVGVQMVPVAYKGTPLALIDLIGGQVHVMFAGAPPALPQVNAGKLRAIAVTGRERLSEFAGVPALAETLPGFEASVWYGLLAPAGTPADIVTRLNAEVNAMLRLPAVRDALAAHGFQLLPTTTAEFAAYMRSEGEKWARVIRRSGVTVAP